MCITTSQKIEKNVPVLNLLYMWCYITLTLCSVLSMGGDHCQKYLFLVDVQTYFVGTVFMVIFLFERHLQI